jgi:hypothetical protein
VSFAAALLLLSLVGVEHDPIVPHPSAAHAPPEALPGREADARVARIAFRLADAGRVRCPTLVPSSGLVLQHLSQFDAADRAGIVAVQPLDHGAGVIAVVPGSPASMADVRPGDVLVAVDGAPLPPEAGLTDRFDAVRAHARADLVEDVLARDAITVTLLRAGRTAQAATIAARIVPRQVCPSRVRLARSDQRNAYADGRHVFVTTGLLARMDGDDELAFILAHEMAHNILGHAAAMRREGVKRGIGATFGRSGTVLRQAERDADMLAGELMLDAGFDPIRGAEALRHAGGVDLGIAVFAAHAPTGARIAAMRALVAARGTR